jgi:predicted transcriptional regulator
MGKNMTNVVEMAPQKRQEIAKRILIYLGLAQIDSASHIAESLRADVREVQDVLIELDDSGDLLMRNGIYRLSEARKLKI